MPLRKLLTHIIKHTRYPNNEIRVVHYCQSPPREKDGDICASTGAESTSSAAAPEVQTLPEALSSNLDISSDFRASGFGKTPKRTKFGSNAKNTLLRIGGALDTLQAKPYHYVMLTGTLPGGTPEAMQAIADWSSWITEACMHWLTKYTQTEHYFYVWELQDRGALHIHICVYIPDTYQRCWVLYKWWDKWKAVIEAVCNKSKVDLWQRADGTSHYRGKIVLQADAQTVYKSVVAYLSGYCGGAKDKHKKDILSPYYPTRWWGASRASTKLLKQLTEEVKTEYINYREANYQMLSEYERITSDTSHCHRYPHKAGIGSTIVSYHPEDKGYSTWLQVKMKLIRPSSHLNLCCLILQLRKTHQLTTPFLRAYLSSRQPVARRVLLDLEDFQLWDSLRRWQLNTAHYRILLKGFTLSDIPCTDTQLWERTLTQWKKLQAAWNESLPYLEIDKNGWVVNQSDIPCTVDKSEEVADTGTSSGQGSSSIEGGDVYRGLVPSETTPFLTQLSLL